MPKKHKRPRKQPHTGRAAAEHRRLARQHREEEALNTLNAAQWPEEIRHMPIDPRRNLPIPFIVEQPRGQPANFGILDYGRARFCYERRRCAMCGKRMNHDVALLGDVASLSPDGAFMEAPVHERCIELAIGGLCPYLHEETYPRRRILDSDVVTAADAGELWKRGRTIPKRPTVVAIAADYAMATLITDTGNMPIYQALGPIKVRFFTWQDGVAAEAGLELMDEVPMDPE